MVPVDIKHLEEYKAYERELKCFLKNHAFCSAEEIYVTDLVLSAAFTELGNIDI
jgi:hypothetical protein